MKLNSREELIDLASQDGGYIVCSNFSHADAIMMMAKKMGKEIKYPLTYYEFTTNHFYCKGVKSIYVENIDCLIDYIGNGAFLKGYTTYAKEGK